MGIGGMLPWVSDGADLAHWPRPLEQVQYRADNVAQAMTFPLLVAGVLGILVQAKIDDESLH